MKKTKKLLDTTKPLHRWLGLAAALYFALMGVTGILLNHPDALSGLDLPRRLFPGDYEFRNWNRNSLRGSARLDGREFVFGEAGVWESRATGGQRAFSAYSEGLPASAYLRDVRALLPVDEQEALLAGTRGGLYVRHPSDPSGAWRRLPLGDGPPEEEAVVDIVRVGGEVLVLIRSHLFAARVDAPASEWERFRPLALTRTDENGREESLFRLIFEMHPGRTWGLPGRLLVDASGVLLVFFTVTGAWFWWRKRRRTLTEGTGGRLARSGLALHLRWGLWAAPLLTFVTLTGFFQRPPFLIAIANATYRVEHHPGVRSANPWHDKLRKAVFDPLRDVVVFSTADGFYETPAQMLPKNEATLAPVPGMTPPVSVMGATVFRCQSDGSYLIGSMSGLYLWDRVTDSVRDLFTGLEPAGPMGPPVGEHRVMGLLPTEKGWLWADYDRGLSTPESEPAGVPMPRELADGGRISLWHALFEVHNGRAFGVLLGWWSWIVVPLGGLILLTVTLTGVYDYLLPKWLKRRVAEEEEVR